MGGSLNAVNGEIYAVCDVNLESAQKYAEELLAVHAEIFTVRQLWLEKEYLMFQPDAKLEAILIWLEHGEYAMSGFDTASMAEKWRIG